MGRVYEPSSIRPALLEAVLCIASVCAAGAAAVAGQRLNCTVLVEFGLLSAIVATSAGALCRRYALEVCGVLTDERRVERWSEGLSRAGYMILGGYALLNGLLDLLVPRRDIDAISYPGLIATIAIVFVVALILATKRRALARLPRHSLYESVAQDEFYLQISMLTLVALVGHICAPSWWLDTAADALLLVLVGLKFRPRRAHPVSR